MTPRKSFIAHSAAGVFLTTSVLAPAKTRATGALKTGYAPVNGLKLHYELHGSVGEPLILLHGGLCSTELLGDLLPSLSSSHRVTAVDLQGHGRTADIDRPMSYESMADDLAALMTYLAIEKADIMDYSLGGGVAVQTTIRHPASIRKLVVVSEPCKRDGWYREILTGIAQLNQAAADAMKSSPLYQTYAHTAPKPADWSVLVTKLGAMLTKDYDWSKEVAAIKSPSMLVFGDADAVRPAHAVEFFELLGGGKKDAGWDGSGKSIARLATLPGLTHYNIFSSPTVAATVMPFLDAPMPAA